MSEEEKEAIEDINNYIEKFRCKDNSMTYKKEDIWDYFKFEHYKKIDTILNLIDRLQKELYRKNELILDLKEKLNNIQFEVETAWRKIDKVENNNE